ncbi:hypothetical protein J6590_082443 [Homalodisca vitripennis]|nr:hypothetical protein J6590_082443 [Homalodisca vitripennis]
MGLGPSQIKSNGRLYCPRELYVSAGTTFMTQEYRIHTAMGLGPSQIKSNGRLYCPRELYVSAGTTFMTQERLLKNP